MSIQAMRVPTIFTAVDKFSHVVGTMERNVGSFGKAAEGASMRIGRKMTAIGTRAMIAGGAIGALFIKPVSDAIDFNDQLASVNTLLNASPKKLKEIGREVRDLANKSRTPLEEFMKSYYDLVSAGVAQPKVIKVLQATEMLSVGGQGTSEDASGLILAKQAAFPTENIDALKAANQAMNIVKFGITKLGAVSEAYAYAAVPFGLAGGKSDELDAMISGYTALKLTATQGEQAIGLTLATANKGAGKFKAIYKELGLTTFTELVKRNKGSILKSIKDIVSAGKKKGYNIDQIFGRQGASLAVKAFLENAKVMERTASTMNALTNPKNNQIGESYAAQMASEASKIAMFKNQMKDLRIEIGDALLPALMDFLKYMNPLIKSFSKWAKVNPNAVKGIAGLAVALGALGIVVTAGGWLITAYGWIAKLVTFLAGVGWAGIGASIAAFFESISVGMTAFWIATSEIWIPVALILGAIALIIATFVYWDDITAWFSNQQKKWTSTIGDTWLDLTSSLENSGFGEYFENIGEKLNPILKMFETMFRLLERINFMGMGKVFGFGANALADMQDKVDKSEKAKNPLFNPNSGAGGSWNSPKEVFTPDKNKDIQSELLKLVPGGVFTINLNDPSGAVKDIDTKNVWGVKVKTDSTTGLKNAYGF